MKCNTFLCVYFPKGQCPHRVHCSTHGGEPACRCSRHLDTRRNRILCWLGIHWPAFSCVV